MQYMGWYKHKSSLRIDNGEKYIFQFNVISMTVVRNVYWNLKCIENSELDFHTNVSTLLVNILNFMAENFCVSSQSLWTAEGCSDK
jgi:hypothetical protein